ncbi:MAG: hypothetical protein M1830_004124 [Pleopsidium flavum]|nr:MAG: hypothetical protein M1830_004124 [Pleopsidium flavum]
MPLTELSVNHIGRNGLVSNDPGSHPGGNGSGSADQKSAMAPTPTSVQGMLRTTTEIGDIGQFAVKPTRIPHPVARASLRRPASSHGLVSQHGHRAYKGPSREHDRLEGRQSSLLTHRDKVVPGVISMHGGDSQYPSPITSRNFSDHSYRSYSMTQSSRTSYTLSNHRSYASLRNHDDPLLTRPRSPFAYPTRLKRPGYRPSSPALSEFNGSDIRTRVGLDRGPSFRTSSPSSFYAQRRKPAAYPYEVFQPVPSHPIRPSPSMKLRHRQTKTPPLAIRIPKHTPSPSYSSIVSSGHDQTTTSNRGLESRVSPSQSPRYYDYSEAFEEHETYHSANISMLSLPLIDQTIPEDRPPSVRYELGVPTPIEAGIAELPADEIYQPSADSTSLATRPCVTQRRDTNRPGCDRKSASPPGRDDSILEDGEGEAFPSTSQEEMKDMSRDGKVFEQGMTGAAVKQDPVSQFVPRSRDGSFTGPSPDVQDLGISSPSFSLHQLPAVLDLSEDFKGASHGHGVDSSPLWVSPSETAPQRNWKIPSLNFSRMDLAGKANRMPEEPEERSASSSGLVDTDHPIIYAPVPKRSLSSHSHRNRFSRILSVEEGLAELAEVIATSEAAGRPRTPDRSIRNTSGAGEATPKRPSSRLSIPSLGRMMKLATVGDRDVADRDKSTVQETLGASTNSSIGKLVKQSLQQNASKIVTVLDNDAAVYDVPQVDTLSRRSSGWRTAATNLTMEAPESPVIDATESSTGRYSTFEDLDNAHHMRLAEDLPSLPMDTSFRSFSPPTPVVPTNLPYSFVPLAPEVTQASVIAELEPAVFINSNPTSLIHDDTGGLPTKYKLKLRANRAPATSPPGSRPWNLEESYPWTDRRPSIGVRTPEPVIHRQQRSEKMPRFKLKVSRAATFMEGVVKANWTGLSPKSESDKTGPISDQSQRGHPTRKNRIGNLPSSDRSSASSDSVPVPSVPVDAPGRRPNTSGTANLVPLSPALNSAEVRSFFSDDSSQVYQKGSFRKRISEFKVKLPASRGGSTDDPRGIDRMLTRSVMSRSRASGRISNQSEDVTAGMSNLKYARLKVMERIKGWWQRSAEKVRDLGDKLKGKNTRTTTETTDLYAGV